MQIIEVENSAKEKWNDFVLAHKGEFLQSWEWGEFQAATGNPSTTLRARNIWRFAVVGENDEFLAVALVIKHKLPLGKNYLYCPRAPLAQNTNYIRQPAEQITNETQILNFKIRELIFDKIREIAKKENSVFLKWEPAYPLQLPPETSSGQALEGGGNNLLGNPVSKSVNLQPHGTLILDLDKTEEEILAQMKQKTRYNIRLAEKHGVKVRISNEETFESDFEKFWALTEETTARDKFQSHSKNYYHDMLGILDGEILPEKFAAKLFLAEFEGKVLAANIMIFFGTRATYLHGASGAAYRNFMAPYLLQWEQIKKSREMGFKEYDFWGIAPKNQKPIRQLADNNQNLNTINYKKEWEGITRFKTGFGGREINYPDAIDIVYQPMIYKAIRVAKKVKAILK